MLEVLEHREPSYRGKRVLEVLPFCDHSFQFTTFDTFHEICSQFSVLRNFARNSGFRQLLTNRRPVKVGSGTGVVGLALAADGADVQLWNGLLWN